MKMISILIENVQTDIEAICKDVASFDVAYYRVTDYINDNLELAKKWAIDNDISSSDDLKSKIKSIHRRVRSGVKQNRSSKNKEDMMQFHYDNMVNLASKYHSNDER